MVVLIDLGGGALTRQFVTKARPSYTGTCYKGRCASIGSADGYETSQRDDLEALAYALVEMLGMLPWTEGAPVMNELKRAGVQNKRVPDAIRALISYAQGLKCGETPTYALWRSMFKQLFVDKRYGDAAHAGMWSHGQFDWLTAMGKFKRGIVDADLITTYTCRAVECRAALDDTPEAVELDDDVSGWAGE